MRTPFVESILACIVIIITFAFCASLVEAKINALETTMFGRFTQLEEQIAKHDSNSSAALHGYYESIIEELDNM